MAASFRGALSSFSSSFSSEAQSREFPTPRGTWKVLSEQMQLAFVSRGNPKGALRKASSSATVVAVVLNEITGHGLVWRTLELRFLGAVMYQGHICFPPVINVLLVP